MRSKLLYVDLETTGLNAKVHAIIELAYIIEIDGKVVRRGSYKINPTTYNRKVFVSPKALECNGYKVEEFESFRNSSEACKEFITVLANYLDKGQRFTFVGFNSSFDIKFLQEWMKDSKQDFYGRFISYKDLDVFALVKYLHYGKIIDTGVSQGLEASCKALNLGYDAHGAVADIEATRDLHLHLLSMLRSIDND